MKVGSLFSGVGGLDLGLHRAGHAVVWQCERNPYRRSILRSHWPQATLFPNIHGLVWAIDNRAGEHFKDSLRVDLLCGGFPCQDVSVAGRRAGLGGGRSSLFFDFAHIAGALRPDWLLVENVPGLFSSNGGRDFAVVLATLAELGYGVAWRVVDSRYFGVPQRRRRVFIVGRLGARSPDAFLPFLEGGGGNPPSRQETRPDVASTLGGGSGSRGWCDDFERGGASLSGLGDGGTDDNDAQAGRRLRNGRDELVESDYAHQLTTGGGTGQGHNTNYVTHALTAEGHDASEDGTGRGTPLVASRSPRIKGDELVESDYAHQLTTGGGKPGEGYAAIRQDAAVRRLTTVECSRLQGFPDDWFGEPNATPDGPRYAALGDAVTVNVAEWIGRRIG